MSSFSRFASVLQIAFLNKLPNVVPHHVFVVLSLVTIFKVQYILMKVLALLLWVSSHFLPCSHVPFVKKSIKDVDFERHSASHFDIILYESLNQLHIVFIFVITQEAMNDCNKTVPSHFLLPVQQLGKLLTFYDLLDLQSNKDTSLDLCLRQCWKKNLEVLESCWLLVKSTGKLLDEASMCSGSISTSEVLSAAPTWRYSSPQRTWSIVASPFCDSALQCHGCPRGKGNKEISWNHLEGPSGMTPFWSLQWPPIHSRHTSRHSGTSWHWCSPLWDAQSEP